MDQRYGLYDGSFLLKLWSLLVIYEKHDKLTPIISYFGVFFNALLL